MTRTRYRDWWIIALTFVVALLLTALPLPTVLEMWRPAWVALVLIYWCMALPARVGILVGWTAGLFLDAMTGSLFGQHALGAGLAAAIVHPLHRRVRVLPSWQQGFTIFWIVFVYQIPILWSNGIRDIPFDVSAYWLSPLTSAVMWPLVFHTLRMIRRRYLDSEGS
ncbi:rod shape-determining protein MreD [Thioalkalivibrio sp. HK1]|uniref:rod shape-determining protein MreD n=1 Tax=Thioalkalivibrio sp. HK1 TaxID=1469245 RepID=UPI000472F458|nr:rod shape-determining protein MreD [Thioalkalivibrio sp. HK1]